MQDVKLWVDSQKPRIEEALRTLVEINTFTDNRLGVDEGMDVVSQLANSLGFVSETIRGRHRLLKTSNGYTGPRVLLISHMDTVFPPDSGFLHYEPLGDGFIKGPGVGDIKGGLVMGLWSMLALRELAGFKGVEMIISADEEKGSPTINDWYQSGHTGADYAIGLEPGFPQGELTPTVPLGVVYQRRGYGAIRFTVKGVDTHSGTPENGLNAIEAIAHRIVKIHALNDDKTGVTTNLGTIQGGRSPNTVPGSVDATVSFRYWTMQDGERTRDALMDILSQSYIHNSQLDVWDQVELDLETFIPPMERSELNQKLVDTVLEEAGKLGHNVVPIARGGGSDANHVSGSGTPTICGMGAPAQGIHTTEEKIYLPMLFERVALLASTVDRLINS